MARFLDVSGVTYTPFTYEQLAAPLRESTEAHKAAQERYDALAEEAGATGSLLTDADPRSKAAYEAYMDSLRTLSGKLMEEGLTPGTARGVSEARRRYRTEVTPIANALSRRRELGDEYRKARMSDPTLLAEFDPSLQSLDKWLDNPDYGAYRSTSGTLLEKNTGTEVANLANRIRERGWQLAKGAGGQYFDAFTRHGASLAQVDEAMRVFRDRVAGGDAEASDPVSAMLADVALSQWESSGVGGWGDAATREAAAGYIGRGLLSAVGKDDVQAAANHAYVAPGARAAATPAAAAATAGGTPRLNYRTDNRWTTPVGKRRVARRSEKDMDAYEALAKEGGDAWTSKEAGRLYKRYGGSNPQELGENIREAKRKTLAAKALYYGDVMDYRNVTSNVSGYIRDGQGRRDIKALVTDATTGKGVTGKDADLFLELTDPSSGRSSNTRFAIDPVEGKVVVNSGPHYYAVKPGIFNNYLFSSKDEVDGYLDGIAGVARLDGDAETLDMVMTLKYGLGQDRYVGDAIGTLGRLYDMYGDDPYLQDIYDGVVNCLWGDVLHQSTAGYGAKGETSSTDNKYAYDTGM